MKQSDTEKRIEELERERDRLRARVGELEACGSSDAGGLGAVRDALQERDEALQAVFNATADSIMLLDLSGNILAINSTGATRLGRNAEELRGVNCFELFPREIVEARRAAFLEAKTTGRLVVVQDEREGLHLENHLYPVLDRAGRVRQVAVYSKDVTERVLADRAGQRLRQRVEGYRRNLEAIFTSLPEGLLIVAPDMTVLEANSAFERISGTRRGLLLGSPLKGEPGSCLEGCVKMLRRTVDTGDPVREYRFECRDGFGEDKVVVVNTAPLAGSGERFNGAVLILRDVSRLVRLESELARKHRFHDFVGRSEPMQEVFALLDRLSGLDSTVLLLGESGTGKELAAEALHRRGPRAGGPLVKVNCAALTDELLESELFGHVQGAFTGAIRDRVGRFQAAEGGTIFLDEIGDISVRTQLKLLRFLESREYERVGESATRTANVRVVAATNADLRRKVRLGQFRTDLYYRLKVMVVSLPPLRQRTEDIPLLANHFVEIFRVQMRKELSGLSPETLELLMNQPWPGNVRELRHALEHACILCRSGLVRPEHLPSELRGGHLPPAGRGRPRSLGRAELLTALESARWNRSRAARLLGISRSSLYRRLEELGLP
ncbi:MAG: sigma 54-interacting transcriptional regulator [Desulfovibrio sp.]